MPRMSVSGVWGNERENTGCIWSGLKALMQNKYGDLILLCSVIAAFGLLIVVSAMG